MPGTSPTPTDVQRETMTDVPRSDDDLELASAYLDGEIDADERARVDASPHLLALVAELAAVRSTIATDIPPAARDARDEAIAAALAAAEPSIERTPDDHPDNLAVLPRRYRWVAMAGSAAAAVVLAVVAVTALQGGGGGDDGGQIADAPVEVASDTVGDATPEAAVGGAEDASDSRTTPGTLGAITGPATVLPEVSTPEQLSSYATEADQAVTTFGSDTPSTGGSDVPTATVQESGTPDPAVSPLVPVPTCLPTDAEVLGSVTVRGIPATVVRTDDGSLQAFDGDCTLLLQAQP